ncbi:uncharacterized protein LOC134281202 [Saccostrea cucullata]|uniref:uncharacterized protein LOC134281202 n=1 Tax=Saccostrea cuccullata TaxID=36930 RepID=UPI002ED44211
MVHLIKCFYNNFQYSVGHNGTFFDIKTGARQGCVMPVVLFNLVIDWVMQKTKGNSPRGIHWGLFSKLEDLEIANDLVLMSHTHQHFQETTNRLQTYGQQVGLRISMKTMTLNVELPAPVSVNGEELRQTDNFIYLGSIKPEGGTKEDIHNRLGKAKRVFREMNNIWRSAQYSTSSKPKIYQSCVVSILLYGSECWRIKETDPSLPPASTEY